jgi:hypothetical protein
VIPVSAKQVPETNPTYPVPTTVIFIRCTFIKVKCKVKFLMDTSARRPPGNYSRGVIRGGASRSAGSLRDHRYKAL